MRIFILCIAIAISLFQYYGNFRVSAYVAIIFLFASFGFACYIIVSGLINIFSTNSEMSFSKGWMFLVAELGLCIALIKINWELLNHLMEVSQKVEQKWVTFELILRLTNCPCLKLPSDHILIHEQSGTSSRGHTSSLSLMTKIGGQVSEYF